MYVCMCALLSIHIIKCVYCTVGVVYLLTSILHCCFSLLSVVRSIAVFSWKLNTHNSDAKLVIKDIRAVCVTFPLFLSCERVVLDENDLYGKFSLIFYGYHCIL